MYYTLPYVVGLLAAVGSRKMARAVTPPELLIARALLRAPGRALCHDGPLCLLRESEPTKQLMPKVCYFAIIDTAATAVAEFVVVVTVR